jgi:phosphoribosylanthranilate isomerase
MTKVKICGIQQAADAVVAANAGADFVGLVFVPEYRRRLEPDAARVIVETLRSSSRPTPQIVGIFADQALEDVNHIIGACELDMAQLCGEESLKYCGEVTARVIKVVHVDCTKTEPDDADRLANRVAAYRDAGHLVTLDRLLKGVQGGSGHSFSWDIAARLSQRGGSFLLAGGLSPDNVARAVSEVSPWGVDVSSGIETGGTKDHEKIRAFLRNAGKRSPVGDQHSTSQAKPER